MSTLDWQGSQSIDKLELKRATKFLVRDLYSRQLHVDFCLLDIPINMSILLLNMNVPFSVIFELGIVSAPISLLPNLRRECASFGIHGYLLVDPTLSKREVHRNSASCQKGLAKVINYSPLQSHWCCSEGRQRVACIVDCEVGRPFDFLILSRWEEPSKSRCGFLGALSFQVSKDGHRARRLFTAEGFEIDRRKIIVNKSCISRQLDRLAHHLVSKHEIAIGSG